jgi:DNA-binding LacI/PurR family transcriptional regulator
MVEAALSANIAQPRVILTSAAHPALEHDRQIRLIGIDQVSAARNVIDYLSDLGHRECLFFSGPQDWGDAARRLEAWQERSRQLGWMSKTVHMKSWDASEAYEKAVAMLGNMKPDDLPTAVVTSNDLQAFGVCKALHEAGVRVPEQVSVVGFDDVPGSDFHTPSLTTVRPDFDALGRTAMQELLGMLGIDDSERDGDSVSGGDSVRAGVLGGEGAGLEREAASDGLVSASLIVRESSAAPRTR